MAMPKAPSSLPRHKMTPEQTEGYTLTFEMQELANLEDVDLTVRFSLHPNLKTLMVQSIPMPTMLSDLQDMIAYFEQHIAKLQENPYSEGEIFVPLDLHFQMKALAGEVQSPDDGAFSLLFLVNAGRPDEEEATSVYVGGQSEVTFHDLNLFLSSLRSLIVQRKELTRSKKQNANISTQTA